MGEYGHFIVATGTATSVYSPQRVSHNRCYGRGKEGPKNRNLPKITVSVLSAYAEYQDTVSQKNRALDHE